MFAILALGFAIGLQHALEADHLAAVASIASSVARPKDIIKHGLTWGLGHALTLLVLAGALLWLGTAIPERLAAWLEFGVGVMLCGLGLQALWRVWRTRVHLHEHEHEGRAHLHVHQHRSEALEAGHAHVHLEGVRWRTLAVGFMHGLAGSAALLLLAMGQLKEPWWGLAYIFVFGVGSMVGMGALSLVIAVPLSLSARFYSLAHQGLQVAIGVATTALGLVTMWRHWGAS